MNPDTKPVLQTQQEHLFPSCDVIRFRPSMALQKNSKLNRGFCFTPGVRAKMMMRREKKAENPIVKNVTEREAEKSNKAR